MKIGIVSGSHRPEQSQRVSHFIKERLEGDTAQCESSQIKASVIDLANNPLPLWDQEFWDDKSKKWDGLWGPISKELKSCDGFVIVSPEWCGMVPAGLKNFFLLCGDYELAHKPGLIVTVSAGVGGSYPVAELRMSSYKNNQLCYLPVHVIVRTVAKMFVDETPTETFDIATRERLDHSLSLLHRYAACMKPMREALGDKLSQFPNGM